MELSKLSIPAALDSALERRTRSLSYTRPVCIYYLVAPDYRSIVVGVFGDGENCAYEWFIWNADTHELRTSDCGFGCCGVALCCGLVVAETEHDEGREQYKLAWVPREQTAPEPHRKAA